MQNIVQTEKVYLLSILYAQKAEDINLNRNGGDGVVSNLLKFRNKHYRLKRKKFVQVDFLRDYVEVEE